MLDAGFDPVSDGRAAPTVSADRHETQRELAVALLRLTPQVRASIVLRHVDGLSVAEVAEALGRPEGTVKAQVDRGLRELRQILAEAPGPITPTRTPTRAAPPAPGPGGHSMTLETALRDLRVAAPPSVGFGALVEAGLADRYAAIDTPLGRAFVAWNGSGVSWVSMAEDGAAFEARFGEAIGRPIEAVGALPDRLARGVERRLAGDRRAHIPLDLRGHTPFEVVVWMKALEIPRGEVRPYGWIAAEIGRPKAVRAVGTALAHNPVPLVVPCHRVVRSDG